MRRLSPLAGLTHVLQQGIDEWRPVTVMRLIRPQTRHGRAVLACRVCRGVADFCRLRFEFEGHAIPSTKKRGEGLAVSTFAHVDVLVCGLSITGNQCLLKHFSAQYRVKITVLRLLLLRLNSQVSERHR
jgi:hypothetical protein